MDDDQAIGFNQEFMDALADTSSKMYDAYYDLLASYQFDFTLAEKEWILQFVVRDIQEMNRQAQQDAESPSD